MPGTAVSGKDVPPFPTQHPKVQRALYRSCTCPSSVAKVAKTNLTQPRRDDFVMKNIIRELYYGRLSGIGKPHKMTAAEEAIHQKIEAERQYFDSTLSTEDSARFEAFEYVVYELL